MPDLPLLIGAQRGSAAVGLLQGVELGEEGRRGLQVGVERERALGKAVLRAPSWFSPVERSVMPQHRAVTVGESVLFRGGR